jgi:hypothetical protein
MKFVEPSHFTDPDAAAARKLVEIANAAETVQDGRIHIELSTRSSSTLAAARPITAPVSDTRSARAGCGGMRVGSMCASPRLAPSCSPD